MIKELNVVSSSARNNATVSDLQIRKVCMSDVPFSYWLEVIEIWKLTKSSFVVRMPRVL